PMAKSLALRRHAFSVKMPRFMMAKSLHCVVVKMMYVKLVAAMNAVLFLKISLNLKLVILSKHSPKSVLKRDHKYSLWIVHGCGWASPTTSMYYQHRCCLLGIDNCTIHIY